MNYKQFSELGKDQKITLEQFNEVFDKTSTATIKDNSVRGAKTVSLYSVKVGDWVNNGTRFIKII